MNKRQKKKYELLPDDNIFYLKLLINENDKYNPKIKVKGWRKFLKSMEYYFKKYNCDMAFKMLTIDECLEHEAQQGKRGETDAERLGVDK